MSQKGVCKTAPATLGLLIIIEFKETEIYNRSNFCLALAVPRCHHILMMAFALLLSDMLKLNLLVTFVGNFQKSFSLNRPTELIQSLSRDVLLLCVTLFLRFFLNVLLLPFINVKFQTGPSQKDSLGNNLERTLVADFAIWAQKWLKIGPRK